MPCIQKAYLFEPKPKNRRFHPYELQLERELSKAFKRPMRHFIHDPPFYPWLCENIRVNFDLDFTE